MELLKLINNYINYVYYLLAVIILVMLILIVVRLLAILKSVGVMKDSFNNIVIYLKNIQDGAERIQYTIENSLPDILKALLVLSFLNSVCKDYFKTKKSDRSIKKSLVKQAGIYASKNLLKKSM